jgi:hypothetical protein
MLAQAFSLKKVIITGHCPPMAGIDIFLAKPKIWELVKSHVFSQDATFLVHSISLKQSNHTVAL